MKNKFFIFGMFFILMLNVNAATDYLPKSWYFSSDYIQKDIWGFGSQGYVANDVCHLEAYIHFTNMGGNCYYGDSRGTQYAFDGYVTTTCLNGQNILNKLFLKGLGDGIGGNQMMVFPFIPTTYTNYFNESWVLRPDLEGSNWGKSQTLECDASDGNKTCTIVFSDTIPFDSNDNFVCYNNSATYKNEPLRLWIDSFGVYSELGSPPQNLFYGTKNVTAALFGDPPIKGDYFYLGSDDDYSYNYTESYYELLTTYTKSLIINVTGEPSGVDFSQAGVEVGLYDCLQTGHSDYYMQEKSKYDLTDYNDYRLIVENCCNLLSSTASCRTQSPSSFDDQYGNKERDIVSTCEDPQLIVYYSDVQYPNKFLVDRVNLGVYDDPQTVIMPWGDELYGSTLCFTIKDRNNLSNIKNYTMYASINNGAYFPWFVGTEDSPGFCIGGVFGDSLKMRFSKDGYYVLNTKEYVWEAGWTGNIKNEIIYLEPNISNTNHVNLSGYFLETSTYSYAPITNVYYKITCLKDESQYYNEPYYRLSTDGSISLTDEIYENSYCLIYYKKDDYEGSSKTISFGSSNVVNNITILRNYDNPEGGENPDIDPLDYKDITFSIIDESGKPINYATVSLIGDCGYSKTYTSINGMVKFNNLETDCDYDYLVSKDGYLSTSFTVGSNPFIEVILLTENKDSSFAIYTTKNGTPESGVTVEIYDPSNILIESKLTNDGTFIARFECEIGNLYNVKISKEGFLNSQKIKCEGEGKTYTMDLTDSKSKADTVVEEAENYVFDYLWPIFAIIFTIFIFRVGYDEMRGKNK